MWGVPKTGTPFFIPPLGTPSSSSPPAERDPKTQHAPEVVREIAQFLLNITQKVEFCNCLVCGKSLLKDVKSLLCISLILIFLLIFASSFRWRCGRETPTSRADKMCREGTGASPRVWQAPPFFSDSSPLKRLALFQCPTQNSPPVSFLCPSPIV